MKINFADTEVRDFEPLPAGWYNVAITGGEIRESGPSSKNPGSEYINFEFTVQDGQFENRKVWANASLLPHALFTLKNIMTATGHNTDGELDVQVEDLMGKQLQVKVSQREYNGDTQNDIKQFKAVGEAVSAGKSSLLPS